MAAPPPLLMSPAPPTRMRWYVLAWTIVVALTAWQVALAFRMVGVTDPTTWTERPDPIMVGRHPLHFYHAGLGAGAWQKSGTFNTLDPAFQAGYPKTTVFDNGSRPFELAAMFMHGQFQSSHYSMALVVLTSLVPAAFWLGARLINLGPGGSSLAAAVGILVCWTGPGRTLLESGDANAFALALLTPVYLAAAARHHHSAGVASVGALLATSAAGWYLHAPLWGSVVLWGLLYWLAVARGHGGTWRLGIVALVVAATVPAAGCLGDWIRYWWVSLPRQPTILALPAGDWRMWVRQFGGERLLDQAAFGSLLLTGAIGSLRRPLDGTRRACGWLWLTGCGLLVLTVLGTTLAPLRRYERTHIFFAAICLSIVPAAHVGAAVLQWIWSTRGRAACSLTCVLAMIAAGHFDPPRQIWETATRDWGPRPLSRQRPQHANALLDWFDEHTSSEARILWDDRRGLGEMSWTALLSSWTGRQFLGGLDADSQMEHGTMTLQNGWLSGRPLELWSDEELEGYCRRYNVGWIIGASESVRARLARFPPAVALPAPTGWAERSFFGIRRTAGFVLKGQARSIRMEPGRVTLADVVPENGEVVLSLHYHHGCRVRPGWVGAEREPDPFDPIPFLRLRVPGPTAVITLTWGGF